MNRVAGWAVDTLGAVLLRSEYGTSTPTSTHGTKRIVGMKNVQDAKINLNELGLIEDHPALSKLELRKGDILFNRTNSPALVGKTGIVTSDSDAVFASYLVRFIVDRRRIDPRFLNYWLNFGPTQDLIRRMATRGVSQANVNPTTLKSQLEVPAPPMAEQREIANILDLWDDALEATAARLRLAKSTYTAGLDRLINSAGAKPVLLGDVTTALTSRNTSAALGRAVVMGVSNVAGIVPMRAQTVAADISRYLILPPRGFAYNPMRINVGSIAMSRATHDVLVSPDYVAFTCNEDALIPEYLDHALRTSRWRHDVNAGGTGSVRSRIYYEDLALIPMKIPPLETQRKIVSVLDAISTEITLLDREIELLKEQKRGLMQKLLTGEVRVAVDPTGEAAS